MVTVKKSEQYVIRNPRGGMVCIKFIGDLGDGTERIEFTHGKRSVFYWRGDKKKTQAWKMWETVHWQILGSLENQVGQGVIPGAWVMSDVYYKTTEPREVIDRWEEELSRLSDRVTEEYRTVYYHCEGLRGKKYGS